jgi:hypothetical protein
MNYETFLFTRNQQRDFTAFIRPKELTNKQVSIISSALSYVNDVSDLTREWPSFYCFPIGEYVMLLRHYDSGRKHAGRNIAVLEGIAIKRTRARRFAQAAPHFFAHQDELLAVADKVPDIEGLLTPQDSAEYPWPDVKIEPFDNSAGDDLVSEFVARLSEDRLFVPFNDDGRAMLLAALADPRFPSLYFAFGTNGDVLTRLNKSEIDVDVVSYFNTTVPSLRSRATNEITSELTDYVYVSRPKPVKHPEAKSEAEVETPADAPPPMRSVRPPRLEQRNPADDPLAKMQGGEMLTPREMARRQRELEAQQAEQESQRSSSLFGWLGDLLGKLLGKK